MKAAPPIRSNSDYPANGDKRVPDSRNRAAALRPARWHDHQQPSSSAQRRSRRAHGAANRRAHGRAGPGVVSQRIVSLPRAGDRPDEVGRGASHRRQHERPAGRLLLARANARPGRAALARRTLAGDAGWRSAHRHRRHRRADRRLLRQRRWLARQVGLRLAGLRAGRFGLRRPRHRGHRQPRALPLRSLADPGQQRGLRGRSGFHRRSGEDRQRHHPDHAQPRPAADFGAGGALPARQRHHARRLLLPGGRRRHCAGVRRLPGAHDEATPT